MTLRKMYLVSPEQFGAGKHKVPSSVETSTFDKWLTVRDRMREDKVREKMHLQKIANYLRKVLPNAASRTAFLKRALAPTPEPVVDITSTPEPLPSTSYETPKLSEYESEVEVDSDDEEVYSEPGVVQYTREHFGPIASPYISEHAQKIKRNLDRTYGLRKIGRTFMIGDSPVLIDSNSNLTIKGIKFEGTDGLWQLLTLKNVDPNSVDQHDLQTYKSILELTNGHLDKYTAGNAHNVTGGVKYKKVIARLFPVTATREGTSLRSRWVRY